MLVEFGSALLLLISFGGASASGDVPARESDSRRPLAMHPIEVSTAVPPWLTQAPPLWAGWDPSPRQGEGEPAKEGAGEEEEEKQNKVALFLGGTHTSDEDGFSVGLEYERRVTDLVGLGVLLENTESFRELVVAAPVFLHPVGDLGVLLAPGFELEDSETSFLVRVGLGWDFELGGDFTLAPEVNVDFVEGGEEAFVYGLTLGYEF